MLAERQLLELLMRVEVVLDADFQGETIGAVARSRSRARRATRLSCRDESLLAEIFGYS